MPKYCFSCEECDFSYEETMYMCDIDHFVPLCKECGSNNVYRDYQAENVSVTEGIKTIGSLADKNADKISTDEKENITSKTKGESLIRAK